MNEQLRFRLSQFEKENKDLKIAMKKLRGEIKMLKAINLQRTTLTSSKRDLRNVIADEFESQACLELVRKEKEITTLKQHMDFQISKRITAERRLD